MKVLNIHTKKLYKSKSEVADLLATIASEDDLVWPYEKWPKMRLDNGLAIGSKGGHGPIKYQVEANEPGVSIQFRFLRPKGFIGYHQLEIRAIETGKTEIRHTLDMETKGKATLYWILAIRPLHDALIEDAFDKIENVDYPHQGSKNWSLWVKILRRLLSKRGTGKK